MAKTFNEIDSKVINLIAKETKITGDVIAEGDIRIDGELDGTLDCKGRLVIGNTGQVHGETVCDSCEISGLVEGKLSVAGQLSLKASAKITGDIITGKLSIEPGAFFSGNCNMHGGEAK